MKKPNGYDDCNINSNNTKPEAGGHKAIILNLEECKSKTGKDMVKVYFDFDKDDAQAGLFTAKYKANDKPDKKWPFDGTKWILAEDNEGNTNKQFKRFITAVEQSNNMTVNWEAKDFAAQFKKKKVGIVFGEEEREYNGKIYTDAKPQFFVEYKEAEKAKTPAVKELVKKDEPTDTPPEGFTPIPEPTEDDMPF